MNFLLEMRWFTQDDRTINTLYSPESGHPYVEVLRGQTFDVERGST